MPIAVPDAITKLDNDYVNWRVYINGQWVERGEQICYNKDMTNLETVGFHLRPKLYATAKSILPADYYKEWIIQCQMHGLIHESAVIQTKNDHNELIIEKAVPDRHVMYATLCCYRWSDTNAPLVWQIIEHMKLPNVTFWQALHYGLAFHPTYGGVHSFSPIHKGAYGPYGNNEKYDIAHSIAVKKFFALTKPQRDTLSQQIGTNSINIVTKLAQDLGGIAPNKEPVLKANNIDDLLTSKWTAMYQLNDPTRADLIKLYQEAA